MVKNQPTNIPDNYIIVETAHIAPTIIIALASLRDEHKRRKEEAKKQVKLFEAAKKIEMEKCKKLIECWIEIITPIFKTKEVTKEEKQELFPKYESSLDWWTGLKKCYWNEERTEREFKNWLYDYKFSQLSEIQQEILSNANSRWSWYHSPHFNHISMSLDPDNLLTESLDLLTNEFGNSVDFTRKFNIHNIQYYCREERNFSIEFDSFIRYPKPVQHPNEQLEQELVTLFKVLDTDLQETLAIKVTTYQSILKWSKISEETVDSVEE